MQVYLVIEDPLCTDVPARCEDHNFVLWQVTNNPAYRDWLRETAPDYPVWMSHDLVHDIRNLPVGSTAFTDAPPPTPSSFSMTADLGEPLIPLIAPNSFHIWTGLPDGSARVMDIDLDLLLGNSSGTLTVKADTQLAELVGATTATFGEVTGLFSNNHLNHDVAKMRVVEDDEFPQ